MAWYTNANKKKITVNYSSSRTVKSAVVLHTSASNKKTQYAFFNDPDSQTSCHFHVDSDGIIEQYIDTDYTSWSTYDDNARIISIDTQGSLDDKWSKAQMTSIVKLIKWICDTHKIPVRMMEKSTTQEKGIGWHRIGIDGDFPSEGLLRGREQRGGGEKWSTESGEKCPGDERILQMPSIIESVKAMDIASKASKITSLKSIEIDFEDGKTDSVDLDDTLSTDDLPASLVDASKPLTGDDKEKIPVNQSSLLQNTYVYPHDSFYADELVNTVKDDDGHLAVIENDLDFSTKDRGKVLTKKEMDDLVENPESHLDKCFMQFFDEDRTAQYVYLTDGVTAKIDKYPLTSFKITIRDPEYNKFGKDGTAGVSTGSKVIEANNAEWGTLTGDNDWSEGIPGDNTDTGTMWGNANRIAKWLTTHNFSKLGGPMTIEQAAGVIGNWGQESRVNPSSVQPMMVMPSLPNSSVLSWGNIGGKAVGLAQWDGARRPALVNFSNERGTKWNDMDTQLAFFAHELEGYEGNMLVNAGFNNNLDVHGYVKAFEQGFERAGLPNYAARYKFADDFMNQWNSSSSDESPMSIQSLSASSTNVVDLNDDYEYDYTGVRPLSQRKPNERISYLKYKFFGSRVDGDYETVPLVYNDVLIGSAEIPTVVNYDLNVAHSMLKHHNNLTMHSRDLLGNDYDGRRTNFGITDIINDGSFISEDTVFQTQRVLVHGVANGGTININADSGIAYIYTNGTLTNVKDGGTVTTTKGNKVMVLLVMKKDNYYDPLYDPKSLSSFLSALDELSTPIPCDNSIRNIRIISPDFVAPKGVIEPLENVGYNVTFAGSTFKVAPMVFSTLDMFTQFPPTEQWSPFAGCDNLEAITCQGKIGESTIILKSAVLALEKSDGSWDFSGYPSASDCKPLVVDRYVEFGIKNGEKVKIENLRSTADLPSFNGSEVVYWDTPWNVDFSCNDSDLVNLVLPVVPQESPKCKYVNFELPIINSIDKAFPIDILFGARLFGVELPESVEEANFPLSYSDRYDRDRTRTNRVAANRSVIMSSATNVPERNVRDILSDPEGHLLSPIAPKDLKVANNYYSMSDHETRIDNKPLEILSDLTVTNPSIIFSNKSLKYIQIPRLPEGVEEVNGYCESLYGSVIFSHIITDGKPMINIPPLPTSVKIVNNYLYETFKFTQSDFKNEQQVTTDDFWYFISIGSYNSSEYDDDFVRQEAVHSVEASRVVPYYNSKVSEMYKIRLKDVISSSTLKPFNVPYLPSNFINVEESTITAYTNNWMFNTYNSSVVDPRNRGNLHTLPKGINHINPFEGTLSVSPRVEHGEIYDSLSEYGVLIRTYFSPINEQLFRRWELSSIEWDSMNFGGSSTVISNQLNSVFYGSPNEFNNKYNASIQPSVPPTNDNNSKQNALKYLGGNNTDRTDVVLAPSITSSHYNELPEFKNEIDKLINRLSYDRHWITSD